MTEKRTILLLGRTGNGKSTIANVISNTNQFAESEYGVSGTKCVQEMKSWVREESIEFHIIDTIGIGDTKFNENEVLFMLADAINAIKNGLNQIFFVTSGKFTEEEAKAYNIIQTIFFADDISKYTTIIRTNFPSFRRAEKCKSDREKMIAENEEVADIILSCKKLIHVNNMNEEEDPDLRSRKECRDILRAHLKFNCSEIYRPRNLDEINERISIYLTDKERIQKEMDEISVLLIQSQERAINVEEAAREREKRLQQEFEETLNNLSCQHLVKEDSITITITEQMNTIINDVGKVHGATINELKGTIENLNIQMNSERAQHQNAMSELRDFYRKMG
ncbi:11573_t:CDS:1, partial [Racocetra fulgida]